MKYAVIGAMGQLWTLWSLFYYRWALHDMGLTHPNASEVILRINELERQL